jgi:hypothetical protein
MCLAQMPVGRQKQLLSLNAKSVAISQDLTTEDERRNDISPHTGMNHRNGFGNMYMTLMG